MKNRIFGLIKIVFDNFAPLVAFLVVSRFLGTKAAIAATVALGLFEFVRFRRKGVPIPPFFKFSTALLVGFGVLDLFLKDPIFLKFEAPLVNAFFGIFFGKSLFVGKPIVQEFAEEQGRIEDVSTEDKTFFFSLLTGFWTLYFFAKAALYLWLNLTHSLENGILLRFAIGNVSMMVMLFISIGLGRPLWRLLCWLKWMPSTRRSSGWVAG